MYIYIYCIHIIFDMIKIIIPTVIGVMFTNIANLSWALPQVLDSALTPARPDLFVSGGQTGKFCLVKGFLDLAEVQELLLALLKHQLKWPFQ